MNAQEIFDTVARHLLRQNACSRYLGDCMYRNPNGLRCAVGILIPDDKYHENIETFDVYHPLVQAALPREVRRHTTLLRELQEVHDEQGPENWLEALKECAAQFSLEWRL